MTQGDSLWAFKLDGAYTKYQEITLESEWRGARAFARGSYTWSHYYGTFDQDNATFNTANDTSTFIGSSFIADGSPAHIGDNARDYTPNAEPLVQIPPSSRCTTSPGRDAAAR